ncbi:MAG: ABC transporter ATP-binding protein, partial [Anaerolineae bacterium]
MNIPLRRYWELLAAHIRPQKGRFTLLTVLLFSGIGLQIANPQIMRRFIDTATTGGSTTVLAWAAVAFISIALVQQAIGVAASYLGENVAWTATNALRAELARHCLDLDMGFHNETTPGQLIERIDGDVAQLAQFFSQLVIRVVGNLFLLVGVLVALGLEDWRIGVAYTGYAVLTVLGLNCVRNLAVPHEKARRQAEADLFGFLEERLVGTEDVRSCGAVEFVLRGLYKLQHSILIHWRRAANMYVIVHFVGEGAFVLGIAIALIAGYYLFRANVITIGTAYLIVHYTQVLGRPIHELTQHTESVQTVGASTERLWELRRLRSKTVDGPGAEFPTGPLSLRFGGVSFSYVSDEPVLEDVSFNLAPGGVLGLLGRTGSGKTTIARLVFRLYDATAGTVELGGVDTRQAKLKDLRRRVAFVTQDVQLFQASVRDNLTFFSRSVPDERIVEVLERLELGDWYRSLPQGLDSKLESGGRGLSAGEAQLLAFARAFLRDPGLVILDEASSRLDPATEQRIERAVDRLLAGRTAIIIAHR